VALEWLAYSGSMLNPIIYHVFNPDFRRAFDSLLRCRCCRDATRHAPRRAAPASIAARGTSVAGRRTSVAGRGTSCAARGTSVATRGTSVGGRRAGVGVPMTAAAAHRQSAVDIPTCRIDAV